MTERAEATAAVAEAQPARAPAETAAGPVATVLNLQRTAGNRAVNAVLARKQFKTDVAEIKAAVGEELLSHGQFQFNYKIGEKVYAAFNGLATAKWDDEAERSAIYETWLLWNVGMNGAPPNTKIDYKKADEARKRITTLVNGAKSSQAAALKPLLGSDGDAGYGNAAATWQKHFRTAGSTTPDVSKLSTLAHLQGFTRWERIACMQTTNEVAKRYVASGKRAGKRSAATAMGPTQLTSGKKAHGKAEVQGAGSRLALGDVFEYTTELPAVVAKMKAALDDGWMIHVRVASGATAKDEEHSLLVLGYDGDVFHFFDADVGGSNVHTPGYERLFFDRKNNRLTTAYNDAEMAIWREEGDASKGEIVGYHAKGAHRYQAMRLWTT